MKKLLFSFLFVLCFSIEAQAATPAEGGVNVIPKPESQSAGKLVYENSGCFICHGNRGRGDGPMAAGLDPKPRNFADLKVMSRISDMSMYHAIKNGIADTAMDAWELPDEEIFDAIAYIKTFLADSQLTINICLNEQRTIDLQNLNIDENHKIVTDQKQYLKLTSNDNSVLIKPNFTNVLNYFNKTGKKLIRNHVMVARQGQSRYRALIAVRISDCLK